MPKKAMMKTNPKIEDFTKEAPHLQITHLFEFPNYIFRQNGDYHCGKCGHVYGQAFKHHVFMGEAVCLHCGNTAKVKQLSSRTNWENYVTEHRAQVIQAFEGKLIFRQYEVIQKIVELREIIEANEIERITIGKGVRVECVLSWSWRTGKPEWQYGHIFENDRCKRPKTTKLVVGDWTDVLNQTELKYTGLDRYLKERESTWYYHLIGLATHAGMYPWIELLMKSGMTKLYADIIEGRADMRYCRPKTIKAYRAKIMANNYGSSWLSKRRMSDRMGLNVTDATLDNADITTVSTVGKAYPEHAEKMLRYLNTANSCNPTINVYYYFDYLTMLDQLGTPADDHTRYPKDLRKAHDDAMNKLNAIKREKDEQSFSKRYQELKRLEWSKDGILVIAPKSAQEILDEGESLHHCVGSYIDKVLKGDTSILFVRTDKATPLYTMEYKGGHIIQVRGVYNNAIPPEVRTLLDEWRAEKNRRKSARKGLNEQAAVV